MKGLVFTDPVEETKKVIEELTGQVDVMIGVMHMGLDNENNTPHSGVRDIANGEPGACSDLCRAYACTGQQRRSKWGIDYRTE